MNIIEVKNNYVKLCYEGELVLSEFVLIHDNNKSYAAQVLHLEAARIGKTAVAVILFNYNERGISAYDGSIPSLRAKIEPASPAIILETLGRQNPLKLAKLAQQEGDIVVDYEILKDRPIIIAEKYFAAKVLLNNLAMQIQVRKNKLVVFDTFGIFKTNRLTAAKDFKLPLNNSTINYIYNEEFKDATAESKAMIQSIFEELAEYSKTVEFIPFDTFQAVVSSEFLRTKLIQLVILKNKINQLHDRNVFAQTASEFNVLKEKLENENTVVIDISYLNDSLQKECIKYVYKILSGIDSEFFVFTPLSNENSDKLLLKQMFDTENADTTIICGYDYKYLSDLKKCSKNMLMFTPLKQQNDFGRYNIFLQKLAEDEFIAYGKMTKFVPLIAKLHPFGASDISVPAPAFEAVKDRTSSEITQTPELPLNTDSKKPVETDTISQETYEEVTAAETSVEDFVEEEVKEDNSSKGIESEILDVNLTSQTSVEENSETEDISLDLEEEPIEINLTSHESEAELKEDAPIEETPDAGDTPSDIEEEPVEIKLAPQESEAEPAPTGEVLPELKEDAPIEETPVTVDTPSELEEEPIEINLAPQEPEAEPAPTSEVLPELNEDAPIEETPDTGDTPSEPEEEPVEIKLAPQEPEAEPAEINETTQNITEIPSAESVETQSTEDGSSSTQPEQNEIEKALLEAPELQDDDELSDDDLDMIEKLSKPNEEIEIINQTDKPAANPDVNQPPADNNLSDTQPSQTKAPESELAHAQKGSNSDNSDLDTKVPPAPSPNKPLQTRAGATPVVPVFPSDIPEEDKVHSDKLQAGDKVIHQEFGEGIVEKMINYGDKLLCSVNFSSVGRRLLNPEISEMKKI